MGERFITTDGVELGVVRHGQGEPLVLVHGGATDKSCFDPLIPLLSPHREVVTYDRRGRGDSGDGAAGYEVQRELLDLAELCQHVGEGEPVDVFGYSYGGTIAVTLAASDEAHTTIRRLTAYEPPFNVPGMLPDGLREDVARLVADGQPGLALRQFITRAFRLPDAVVDAMERHPAWQASLNAAPTLPREFEVVDTLAPPASLNPKVPTSILVGHPDTGGNPAFRHIAELLSKASENVAVEHVHGLPHFAIATDTARVAELLLGAQ